MTVVKGTARGGSYVNPEESGVRPPTRPAIGDDQEVKHPRRFWALVGVLVLALAAVIAYPLLPPRQTDDIALPPTGATPEQVVTAYLDALNAHDCDTAATLMAPGAEGDARRWCKDVSSLKDAEIVKPFNERPQDVGYAAGSHVEVVDLGVAFDLRWRAFHHDPSLSDGETDWGYTLMRADSSAPWRIVDQGDG